MRAVSTMGNTKIFISYKTQKKIYSSSIITPIQTGRAISKSIFNEMIGDDTNENISFLNDSFCELTAIYWAWKNYIYIGNPENIGFMQYRRCFIFNNKYTGGKDSGRVEFEKLDKNTLNKISLNDINIELFLKKYESIIPQKAFIDETIEEQYCKNHYKKDFDILKKVVLEMHPELESKFLSFCSGHSINWYMMFIFKKEIFFKYCEWIFPIIFELHKKISTIGYSDYQKRAIAFMAERLTGFFLQEYIDKSLCKELPIAFFKDTEIELFPVFKEKYIPIIISSSDYYIPYLSVLLQSLVDNVNNNYNYDVIILTKFISEDNKKIIKDTFSKKNISIRYYIICKSYDNFRLYGHMTHETYYRLEIPNILKNYNKCIFLDADIILNDSLVDLYNINIENYMFAAVRNTMMTLIYNADTTIRNYYINSNITMDRYIQAGVLLINLDMCRKKNFSQIATEACSKNKFYFLDQDALSFLFNKDIFFIDNKWNYETYQTCFDHIKYLMSEEITYIRTKAFNDVKIIHYASQNKPWLFPNEELAYKWWLYARKTPYYEICISRMIETYTHSNDKIINKKHVNYKLKYIQYYIFSKITFGNLGRKCMRKKVYYRNILKTINK